MLETEHQVTTYEDYRASSHDNWQAEKKNLRARTIQKGDKIFLISLSDQPGCKLILSKLIIVLRQNTQFEKMCVAVRNSRDATRHKIRKKVIVYFFLKRIQGQKQFWSDGLSEIPSSSCLQS